jgi:hypothetical protein
METTLWDQESYLCIRTNLEHEAPRERAFHVGPLNWMIELVISGSEGPSENLFIRTSGGREFEAAEILALSQLPDRPNAAPTRK